MTLARVVTVVLPLLAFGCTQPGDSPTADLQVLPKEITVEENGSVVECDGRWRAVEQLDLHLITDINAVSISCDKRTMQCHEAISMVTSPADHLSSSGWLTAVQFVYQVTRWDTTIEALSQTRVSDDQLIIELASKTVTKVSTETSARGAKVTGTPAPRHWTLQ